MKQVARIIRNNLPKTILSDGVQYGEPLHVPSVTLARTIPAPPPSAITIGSAGVSVSGSYYWDATSVDADDGQSVIAIDDAATGRYKAVSIVASGVAPLSVATIAALKATASISLTDRQQATVGDPSSVWVYLSTVGADFAGDDLTIVKPTDKTTTVNGRWYNIAARVTPEMFGAKGDAVELSGIGMTNGSKTVSGVTFPASAIGKVLLVHGAGAAGADLLTTIQTTTTAAVTASSTVTNQLAYYGTDDTTAVQAAKTYVEDTGGSIEFSARKGYLVSTLDFDETQGVRLVGGRGACFQEGATLIFTHASSTSLISAKSTLGFSLRGMRLVAGSGTVTSYMLDYDGTGGFDSGSASVEDSTFIGNPNRTPRGIRLKSCVNSEIGRRSLINFVRLKEGVVGEGNANVAWVRGIFINVGGTISGTDCYCVRDASQDWTIWIETEPGTGQKNLGYGYSKSGGFPAVAASDGLDVNGWFGDAIVDDGCAIEIFAAGARVSGHFEDSGNNSTCVKVWGGSNAVEIGGGDCVMRAEFGIVYVAGTAGAVTTNSRHAAIDFQGCTTPISGYAYVSGLYDSNGAALLGYQHYYTGGAYYLGLVTFPTGSQHIGWGQLPTESGWYIGYLGQHPAHTAVAAAWATLGAGTLKAASEGGGSAGNIEGTASIFIPPSGTWLGYYSVGSVWTKKFEVNASGLKIGDGSGYISKTLRGTTTWDPGDIADGAMTSTTVSVTGSTTGDGALVSFTGTGLAAGAILTGIATADGTVTVTLFNKTGGNLDLGSGTVTALILKSA